MKFLLILFAFFQTTSALAQRLVTLDINSTELALALGLQDKIVGVAGVENPQMIIPEFKAIAKNLNYFAPSYPSFAELQALNPDLVIGGWRNGFSKGTPMEPESLQNKGIGSYVLRETRVHEKGHIPGLISFESTLFADIQGIAHLTDAEAASNKLLEQMQRRLARVEADVKEYGRVERVRILVYDGGIDQALSIGNEALLSEAIRVAGGRNILEDRPGTWQNVNWADVASADPELIVVVDYGSGDAIFKVQDLVQIPALQAVSAIRNKKYFVIPYAPAITGIRSVGITELLADHLICTFNTLSQGAQQCLDVASSF